MSEIELLLSTMNNNYNFVKSQTCEKILTVNQIQTTSNAFQQPPAPDKDRIITTHSKGLSKSRNILLEYAVGPLCLLCDDDVTLLPDFSRTITQAFIDNPSYDIITFQILCPDGSFFNSQGQRAFEHSFKTLLHCCSISIAFRIDSIRNSKLTFDERFGLGAAHPVGEDNLFLLDARKKGLRIGYTPLPISIHPKESTGTNIFNPITATARGAV